MRITRILILSMMLLSGTLSGGCAVPVAVAATAGLSAAQAGTSAYVRGELSAARYATMDEAWQALQAALDEYGYETILISEWPHRHVVRAEGEHGPAIRIQLEKRSPRLTKIRVRVGLFGDLAISRALLQRFDRHLLAIVDDPVPGERRGEDDEEV